MEPLCKDTPEIRISFNQDTMHSSSYIESV